jgi:protein-tyrosine phosphatase
MTLRWVSLIFTRGQPRPPYIDPQSLIIEPPDRRDGAQALSLEGAVNFRDLGGYRTADGRHVQYGRVFRSGALAGLTDTDLNMLRDMGLRQVFDLRTAEEMAAAADRVPEGAEYVPMTVQTATNAAQRIFALVRYYNQLDKMLLDSYIRVMLEGNAGLFGELFRRLAADEGTPAVFHCTAGKDRTGVTAALLLAALGVPEATIIADYSLTNRCYADIHELVKAQAAPLLRLGLTIDDMHPLMLANPEAMRTVLAYLRQRYGSVDAYLRERAGVDEATLARLRDLLLE